MLKFCYKDLLALTHVGAYNMRQCNLPLNDLEFAN